MSLLTAVILAAGEGKRMRSRQPKVLHRLCGRPLVAYPVRAARSVAEQIVMVVGPDQGDLSPVVGGDVRFAEQRERLGTGHALLQAQPLVAEGTLLVLPGDTPLLSGATLQRLVAHHQATRAAATLLTAIVDQGRGYGRVLRQGGRVAGVVEERDATDDQKAITEINTSVYCFETRRLWPALAKVRAENAQGEYYLTDVIGILARGGQRVEAIATTESVEALGVNDRKQLAALAAIQQRRILDRLMDEGVTILDPAATYIEDTVTIGADTVVYPQAILEGDTVIGSDCTVGAGCHIRGSRLADRVTLKPYCVITDSAIDDDAILGPFCHLRPQSHVGPTAHIGNFVELKKSRIGRGAKANHLAYLGDATVGDEVNVGAGTITCNYDGVAKYPTTIGDRAFIGTNASLVAPITVGADAYVGAGSVITKDVPPGALAVARGQQFVKEGWATRRAQQRTAKREG